MAPKVVPCNSNSNSNSNNSKAMYTTMGNKYKSSNLEYVSLNMGTIKGLPSRYKRRKGEDAWSHLDRCCASLSSNRLKDPNVREVLERACCVLAINAQHKFKSKTI